MDIVYLAIVLWEVIDLIAAIGVGIPSCQRGASLREQQMRRGYSHKFYRGPAKNRILRDHGYLNITTGSYLTCAGMCLQDDACKSFNFCLDDKLCELNTAVYVQYMAELMFANGCQYFDEEYHEPETEEPTTEEPTTEEPTTEEPSTVEPTTQEPTTQEPSTVEPTTQEPTTEESSTEGQTTPGCALGVESGAIPDGSLNSSGDRDGNVASGARLNANTFWEAMTDAGCWIRVDLGEGTTVAGIITQGDGQQSWVIAYRVTSTFPDGSTVTGTTRFNGNTDATTAVTNMFSPPVTVTAVKIEPTVWNTNVRMRLELLGC